MESKVIDNLMEKYLNGETSLQEEARLRDYFGSGWVAPHLQEYIPLFAYFQMSREENYSGKIHFHKGKKRVYSWVGIAASIVLAAGLFLQQPNKTTEFGSYEDPELAMQRTKEALQLVSQYMNSGTEELVYLKEFDNAKNKISRK
ncbi:hypothetical protein GCM10007103_15660 [Salinimicrobium marinum]|uniref:Uncharacterized protein n=1 Tax=Salinimicrobium marinum TaxID=680283 RepID=A0A918SD33_9FLAO|nr:hypothetical protein [Salinimicrobium marinum]GHA34986.1 hypothetical protein GCM10007103_15660 [Salinimicrobium marinum]